MNNHKVLIVNNRKTARILLHLGKGYKILDIRPHRDNEDKSVFVFANEGDIYKDYQKITSVKSQTKELEETQNG